MPPMPTAVWPLNIFFFLVFDAPATKTHSHKKRHITASDCQHELDDGTLQKKKKNMPMGAYKRAQC